MVAWEPLAYIRDRGLTRQPEARSAIAFQHPSVDCPRIFVRYPTALSANEMSQEK